MRHAGIVLLQLAAATVGLAAIGGLIGFLVVHFTGWGGGAGEGFGWGMIVCGVLVGFAAGGSGSPTDNMYRGRVGAFGTYWGQSSALPQSPLQLALGGLFAFAGGIALLILVVY
jgi:hypothetical protein